MSFICDDVHLWGVRHALDLHEDCALCKNYYIPNKNRNVSSARMTGDKTASPGTIRERRRLEAYHRQAHLDKARRDITALIQKKRREEFVALRQALYMVYTYSGPYLQKPGDKKKAAEYLRRQGFGQMFVEMFEEEVKWKWLDHRVKQTEILTGSAAFRS
ncbi:hypothetical protein DFH28DRAFT_933113 [Melampsora americana]|nr:hypothetical protein DFH28DRAFT_933113 [Melampsora americana]